MSVLPAYAVAKTLYDTVRLMYTLPRAVGEHSNDRAVAVVTTTLP